MPQPPKKSSPPQKKTKTAAERGLGWLGRQIGHVKKAVSADVTKLPPPKAATSKPKPTPQAKPASKPTVVFRDNKVEEAELPNQPGVKLRRTIIDEVIVDKRIQ